LRSLPQQPFEAAALDGVPRLFVFFRITLPMLSPYIITASLFRLLDAIQQFDIVYAMTQGGPGNTLLVFQVRAYLEFYQYTNVGKSAALLVVLWAITYFLSNIFIKNWLRLRERSHASA
jgi:multiple sugar transport system permease protein